VSETEFRPGDSVAWHSTTTGTGFGTLVWGLVREVAGDGTLTVLSGAYQRRVSKRPDEITRHESGPDRFHKVYPGSRTRDRGRLRGGRGRRGAAGDVRGRRGRI